ncbi:MAG: hypothetical protein WDM94_03705 [Bauldia sp.]
MTAAANSLSVPTPPPLPQVAPLRGRIDAIDGTRVYGWAWYPAAPRERISVRIFDGDEQLAVAVADKPRIDLRRNGVGDGAHAFDIELQRPVSRVLRVVAMHPSGGPDLELDVPVSSEPTAESAIAASFGPILDRLEAAIVAQRRIQARQSGSLGELNAAAQRLAEVATADGGLVDSVKGLGDRQQSMADRISELEVLLVRFDGVTHTFHNRLEALAKQHVHPVKGHLMWLAAAVGLVIGVAVTAAMRL